MAPALFVDGRPAAALPLPDRGLSYGDGVFETLLARGTRVAWAGYHRDRLRAGLAALSIPEPPWEEQLHQALATVGADGRWRTLRVTVSRGAGPRGYAPPAEPAPRTVLEVGEGRDAPPTAAAPLRTGVAALAWSRQPALAGHKHLNRLEQVLAAAECRRRQLDDLLVCDDAGAVISTTAANLFLVQGGSLLTPRLDGCGIAGTRRRLVLEVLAPALGLRAREETLPAAALAEADAAFCCNSVRGLAPLASCEAFAWPANPLVERLRQRYHEALSACVA